MSLIKLPYLGKNSYAEVNKSPKGYSEISGIEQYNDSSVRNVRIVRVDLVSYLLDHFSEDVLSKHRNELYYIFAGYGSNGNTQTIVSYLEYVYTIDKVFQVKLGKIVYFRDTKLEGLSIYEALIEDVRISLGSIWNSVVQSVPHVKLICDSHLYLYFSVSETMSITDLLQIRGLEVISR